MPLNHEVIFQLLSLGFDMTRSISANLKSHFESENTSLATCWKIIRTDNIMMGFTDHVEDINFASQNYIASSGFQPTDVLQRDDLSVDNMDIAGILDSSYITESDIQAGIYDFAEIEIFMVNYTDLSQGRMWLKRGWIGEVKMSRSQFQAEIRGLSQKLSQNIGRLFTPSCDAILGDYRCGLDLSSFTENTTITEVINNQTFSCSALSQENSYFQGGEVVWISGNNQGFKMEIKDHIENTITLALPMSNNIQVGDSLDLIAGCNKSKTACKDKFNNFINFRGFPDLPGQDKSLETAGTFSAD